MNYDLVAKLMLKAKKVSQQSNCDRRKIGAVISNGSSEVVWGWNDRGDTTHICTRELGFCPAIHAEVMAIQNLQYSGQRIGDSIFVWCEIPCHNCLNFIAKYSRVRRVYCLSLDSYKVEYPRVSERSSEVTNRRAYARSLGIDVIELDREEILEHELSDDSRPSQP